MLLLSLPVSKAAAAEMEKQAKKNSRSKLVFRFTPAIWCRSYADPLLGRFLLICYYFFFHFLFLNTANPVTNLYDIPAVGTFQFYPYIPFCR